MLNQPFLKGKYLDLPFLVFSFVIFSLMISIYILQTMQMAKPHIPMISKIKLPEKNIDKLFDWFSDNCNYKCYVLINTDENVTLIVKNEAVTNSSNQKLRGILFNNKFDFNEHFTSLCRKAFQKLNALSCKSCAFSELSTTYVNYEFIQLFAVWISFVGIDAL